MGQLSYKDSQECIEVAFQRAREDKGKPVSVAVVEEHGDLLAFGRMDGAPVRGATIAVNKAYTAARMERNTHEFAKFLSDQGYHFLWFGDPRLTGLMGGVMVKDGDRCIGAIGVSGRTGEEDFELAQHALAHLLKKLG